MSRASQDPFFFARFFTFQAFGPNPSQLSSNNSSYKPQPLDLIRRSRLNLAKHLAYLLRYGQVVSSATLPQISKSQQRHGRLNLTKIRQDFVQMPSIKSRSNLSNVSAKTPGGGVLWIFLGRGVPLGL